MEILLSKYKISTNFSMVEKVLSLCLSVTTVTSVNILIIINNVITYALRIVLINLKEKEICLRALENKQNMTNSRPMYSLSAC